MAAIETHHGPELRSSARCLKRVMRRVETFDDQALDPTEVLDIGGEQRQAEFQRSGGDHGVAELQAAAQCVLVDQAHGAFADAIANERDLRAASAQGLFYPLQFRLIAAALRQFHVSNGADSPVTDLLQPRRRPMMSAREPDKDVGINQHENQLWLRDPSGL